MFFTTFLKACTFVSLAQAITVPRGTADGSYRAYYDERGVQVTERLDDANVGLAERELTRRSDPGDHATIYCGCGNNLDHGNCDTAVAALKAQLGNGVALKYGQNYFTIVDNVVAFVCPLQTASEGTYSSQGAADSFSKISDTCGEYVAGTVLWTDVAIGKGAPTKVYGDVGYMIYTDGLDFCAQAQGGTASSC